VNSPTIARLVAMTNTPSDNFFAEMLLKGLGARFGAGGSTAAGAGVVIASLRRQFGIHPKLVDGSGLSYADSTSPSQMVTALTKLRYNHPFWDSLAVGGESGTLADEMRGTRAQGNCRGKTGTLSSVANLVGYCHARNGHTLAFAFYANSVGDTAAVHSVEGNQMAVALADYTG
jgi:D-alanyl-D-alanine carboxypeptidase/D-alanyl-D-alanine-endopeptidase (penicillin-binding protein 4)